MRVGTCRLKVGDTGARLAPVLSLDAWWVQFGEEVLVYSANARWAGVKEQAGRADLELDEYPKDVRKGDMYLVVQKGRLFQQEYSDVPVLLDKGRYLVVALSSEEARRIGTREEPCFVVEPLRENTIVFDVRRPPAERRAPVAWVQDLVDEVNQPRLEATLTDLVSYPTRYSTSSHYADVAAWVRQQLQDMGYTTVTQSFSVAGSTSTNVIAERTGGGMGTRDLVLVTAHLDSINSSGGPAASAPGADDNASGVAALLEMAQVLKDHSAEHDLRFVLFGGEEQGLRGSAEYVAGLPAGEQARISAVVNMDMIGSLNTPVPTVLLEGATVSQTLIDALAEAAGTYSSLTVQTSLHPYASDHVPFINADLPAVLTIEGADGANSFIHTAGDTLDHLNLDLALEILRMNVATVATRLGRGGITMLEGPIGLPLENWWIDFIKLSVQLSGRYEYGGGAGVRVAREAVAARGGHSYATLKDPAYELSEPIYLEELQPLYPYEPYYGDFYLESLGLRFTLHIDIDGTDPLNVVSGTVAKGLFFLLGTLPHFIGRVTSNTVSGGVRNLVVEDFSFGWPGGTDTIDRLEIALTGSLLVTPTAEVTFIDTARENRHGPYTVTRRSMYFREVEVEVDVEDGAIDCEPYNTHTHPDRPADLPEEDLTLEKAFARAGIKITRSAESNVIDTTDAGANNTWSYQELHDAMEEHWSAFANIPQWKMWIFLAERADSATLGGVMFDGNIDEPGGVDRQGTAIFTKCEYFHATTGGYPQANPPAAEAAERELFFNLIHETGHAYNLAHSWQKHLGTPWPAPSWMPMASSDTSLSWMNYPDRPTAGANATWFYDRFRFRFDDNENLFLRHAPGQYVQMGAEPWLQNHGRVARGSLDRRLELVVRSRKATVDMGEPVFIELRLRNVGHEPVMVHLNMDPSDRFVALAVTNPRGERWPLLPIAHVRALVKQQMLAPGQAIYQAVDVTAGQFGFPFKEPGPYRIEASYVNMDGSTAAAVMQLWVRPPANYDDLRTISELFNARVARVLYVGGSRVMEDVNSKLDWVSNRLGEQHPARYYLAATRAEPMSIPYKILGADADRLQLRDPEPEFVVERLGPVIEDPEAAADAVGHIRYRQIVDTFTRSALDANEKAKAHDAQKRLLGLFKKRAVIPTVIEAVEQRVKELK